MLALFLVFSVFLSTLVQSKCGKRGKFSKDLDRCFCKPGWYGTFCTKKWDDRCNSPTNLVGFQTRNTSNDSVERIRIIASVYDCTNESACTWSSWERLKLRPNDANKRQNKACQDFQSGNVDYDDHFNDYGNIRGITIYNCDADDDSSGWGLEYISFLNPSDRTKYRLDSFCGDLSISNGTEYGLDDIESNSDQCMGINETLYDGYYVMAGSQIAVQFNKSDCVKYGDKNYIYTCSGSSMIDAPEMDASAASFYCNYKLDFDKDNVGADGGIIAGTLLAIVFLVCVIIMIGCNFHGINDKLSPSSRVSFDKANKPHRRQGGFRTISQTEDVYHETAETQQDRL